MHKITIDHKIKRIRKFFKKTAYGILSDYIPLKAEFSLSQDPVPFSRRKNGKFREIQIGDTWGEEWNSAWFHLKGKIPRGWNSGEGAVHIDFNGESLIFDHTGSPLYGLTNGSVFNNHYSKDVYRLPAHFNGGESIDLWVEAAANHLFGIDRDEDPPEGDLKRHGSYRGKVIHCELCRFHEPLWHLRLDVEVLLGLIDYLKENSPRRNKIIYRLSSMIDLYLDNRENSQKCRDFIKDLWSDANCSDLTVTGIGHAHIDTGWLWPVRETVRKCARTFASQIDLLEKYPQYVFGASQPQHYQFMKESYPSLYKKIKQYVDQGRWELQGGMWVEADCNLISGESMIRQFLHGKNFFMDEFGIDVTNLWLPDVFGYSSAMPQILRKCGVDFFMTQKISWNQYNQFPFHLFNWKGIDGTEIVTHFLPENEYNSNVDPAELGKAQDRFNENYICDEFLSLFGIGNGGGGPKEEHIERGLRLRNLEGSPKWRFGKAQDTFERMKKLSPYLDTWSGELYLELHRGTLTTQALTKKYNRTLENRLMALEYLCSANPLVHYPSDELDKIWKNLLMNQFHDIIPGSSIKLVYDRAHREYRQMSDRIDRLFSETADILLDKDKNFLTIINCLSVDYTHAVSLPESWRNHRVTDEEGNLLPVQQDSSRLSVQVLISANSYQCLKKGEVTALPVSMTEGLILENEFIRYELNQRGQIISAFDKETEFEVMISPGNVLSLYVDRPQAWDAWDVDLDYEKMLVETAREIKMTPLESGPIRQGVKIETKIGQSKIVQNIYLYRNSRKIDFLTIVDWRERHKMLRTSFPVNIFADEASCDIQYGFITRPTHRNTTWDLAKFEVAAHKYVDLSDKGYGAALMNDCKYGYKIHQNVLDLNLLRSPTNPDAEADRGIHEFTYSFLPHRGALIESTVMEEALQMNSKALVFEGYKFDGHLSPCSVSGEGILLETVKKAEKEDCLILRLSESRGRRSKAVLNFFNKESTLIETDMLEWKEGVNISCRDIVPLEFTPFEIKTFKIK